MEYIRVRAAVLFFQSIAPISLIYIGLRAFQEILPPTLRRIKLPEPITYWLFAEAATFLLLYLPYKHLFLQRPAVHPAALSQEERQLLFARCWATVENPERYLRGWFHGAPEEEIRRENVREFIHWAFFNAEQVSSDECEEVDEYIERIEERLGRALLPGRGDAKSLRTTYDPVRCSYRPLLWNLV